MVSGIMAGVFRVLKILLAIAGWILLATALGAAGLVVAGATPPDMEWYLMFFYWWVTLLQPAVIAAAIVSIFPKGRHTPVFTPVVWATIAVLLFSVLFYLIFSLGKSP